MDWRNPLRPELADAEGPWPGFPFDPAVTPLPFTGPPKTDTAPLGPPPDESSWDSASFCTSIGTSPSSQPGSSSYLHRLLLWAESAAEFDTLTPPSLSSPTLLRSCVELAGAPAPPRLHSALVLASKNPEDRVSVCLCKRYLFSWPPALMMISTSPLLVKTGNSFWDM